VRARGSADFVLCARNALRVHLLVIRAFRNYPSYRTPCGAVTRARARRRPQRHSVAIVGGGIAGFACALALASYGVRSVVLEADDTCVWAAGDLHLPAQHGDPRAMRALKAFLAKGLP